MNTMATLLAVTLILMMMLAKNMITKMMLVRT